MKNRYSDTNDRRRLYIPEQPSEPKEPLRLYLSGKSAAEVAEIIGCERRTAARLIKENLDVNDIGKWNSSHSKLSGYAELIHDYTVMHSEKHSSLLSLSTAIFTLLQKNGYTGSERTVRNYLSRQEWIYELYHSENGGTHVKSYKHR